MNRDDIIRMAREVGGIQPKPKLQPYFWRMHDSDLERLFHMAYAAGAAEERKACAQVCEQSTHSDIGDYWGQAKAVAIRSRGQV